MGKKSKIRIGKLGLIDFGKGYYFYVGSGGIARISRHLRKEKKIKWHIDYLLRKARVIDVILSRHSECNTARLLDRHFACIKGFGCSDCHCKSHLFYMNNS